MKNLLVTGNVASLAAHLCQRLSRQYHMVVAAHQEPPIALGKGTETILLSGGKTLEHVFKAHSFQAMIFLATRGEQLSSIPGEADLLSSALALSKHHGVDRVLYLSSGELSRPNESVSERGMLMQAMEQLCSSYRQRGLEVVIVRLPCVFGPGEMDTLIGRMLISCARGETAVLPFARDAQMDFISAAEVAQLVYRLLERDGQPEELLMVCGAEALTVRELTALFGLLGASVSQGAGEMGYPPMDGSDFQRSYGFSPSERLSVALYNLYLGVKNLLGKQEGQKNRFRSYLHRHPALVKGTSLLLGYGAMEAIFRLQTLGALNAALYLAAAALFLAAMRKRPLLARAGVCAAVPLALGDVGYASYFNSFYSEPAAFIFLISTVALALFAYEAKKRQSWALAALTVSSMLLVWSKAQCCTLGLVLAMLVVLAGWRAGNWSSRQQKALVGILVVALLGVSAARYRDSSKRARRANVFNFAFSELTNRGGPPEATLAALGLDPALARFSGVSFFDPVVEANEADLEARFFSKTSHPKLVLFCLRHPTRLLDLLGRVAPNAFNTRSPLLGQLPRKAGLPAGALSERFSLWSRLKLAAMPSSFGGQVAFWLGFAALFGALWRFGRPIRGEAALCFTGLALFAIAGAQYATAVLGEAEVDLVKHLILANLAFDLGMLVSLSYLLAKLAAAVAARLVPAATPSPIE
jgi:nucleoside-diphosphate-sugar epimerase